MSPLIDQRQWILANLPRLLAYQNDVITSSNKIQDNLKVIGHILKTCKENPQLSNGIYGFLKEEILFFVSYILKRKSEIIPRNKNHENALARKYY